VADEKGFIFGEYFVFFEATQAAFTSSVKLFLMSDFIKNSSLKTMIRTTNQWRI